jgi:hypothetical protein
MIQHYAIRGLDDNGKWQTFAILKATSKQEAIDLLEQYTISHDRGCPYTDFKIDEIHGGFNAYARIEGCRAFVSKTVEDALTAGQTKRELLIGAP